MSDETAGCRRLVLSLLVLAVADARRGDVHAVAWLASDTAHQWADLLGLDGWPPRVELKKPHKKPATLAAP